MFSKCLSGSYIKDAMDHLPIALAYFNEDGYLILCNLKMYHLFQCLYGKDVQYMKELYDMFDGCKTMDHVMIDERTFKLNDHSIWQFSIQDLYTKDGMKVSEVIANDVTVLIQNKMELECDTKELKDMMQRLDQLSKNVIAVTKEEEILTMKMRVHDEIGRGVIASRYILQNDLPTTSLDLNLWEKAVALLKNSEKDLKQDMLFELKEIGNQLGVSILIEGEFPEDKNIKYLIVVAIRECLSNVLKHAGGSKIFVEIDTQDEVLVTITNNGEKPTSNIKEGGGLSTLRKRIEKNHGSMKIESVPEFALKLKLPKTIGM